MARIPPKDRYPWYLRIAFYFQKKSLGAVWDPLLLWGRSPKVFFSFLLLLAAVHRRRSPLSDELRSLIAVKVSTFKQCAFCTDINTYAFVEKGHSKEKLAALPHFRESPLFTEAEKTALEYSEEVLQTVSDTLFQRLRSHFTDDAIVELTALITFQNLSSQFNSALNATSCNLSKKDLFEKEMRL